jgi:DNA repair protein RadD
MVMETPFSLRSYQRSAVDKGLEFLRTVRDRHGLIVLPTGSGKSLCIAELVKEMQEPCLVFQPSREILMQNLEKMTAYGFRPGIYSASCGEKRIRDITLATIGSVINKPEMFSHVRYVIIDEAHFVNPKEGMYKQFLEALQKQRIRVIGFTATPYRLASNSYGSVLRFLTRTNPRIFSELIYYVQIQDLLRDGFMAKLEYFTIKGFDRCRLQNNSTGADYTDASVKAHFRDLDFAGKLERVVLRLLEINRRGVLVFTRFVEESESLAAKIPGAVVLTANTPDDERKRTIRDFKAGRTRVVCNVGVLSVGFDYPELDTIVLARPTKSLALYYQQVGRAVRPHPSKSHAMIVDMVGLQEQFGKVEDLQIMHTGKHLLPCIASGSRPLTNVYYGTD